jgi:hypothetical protein
VTINEEIPHVELPVTFAGNRNIGVVPLEVFRVHAAKDKLSTRRCIRVSVEPEGEDVVLKKFLLFHALPNGRSFADRYFRVSKTKNAIKLPKDE